MMKVKVSFDTWLQLLGMLGVLGGLVALVIELNQSQKLSQVLALINFIMICKILLEIPTLYDLEIQGGVVFEKNDPLEGWFYS